MGPFWFCVVFYDIAMNKSQVISILSLKTRREYIPVTLATAFPAVISLEELNGNDMNGYFVVPFINSVSPVVTT